MTEPTAEQLAQWEREARETASKVLGIAASKILSDDTIIHGYLAARLKAHQEQSARIQELETLLKEAHNFVEDCRDDEENMPLYRKAANELHNKIAATLSGGGGATTTHS